MAKRFLFERRDAHGANAAGDHLLRQPLRVDPVVLLAVDAVGELRSGRHRACDAPGHQRASEAEAGRAGFVDAADGLGGSPARRPKQEAASGPPERTASLISPVSGTMAQTAFFFRMGVDADDGRIAHEAPSLHVVSDHCFFDENDCRLTHDLHKGGASPIFIGHIFLSCSARKRDAEKLRGFFNAVEGAGDLCQA